MRIGIDYDCVMGTWVAFNMDNGEIVSWCGDGDTIADLLEWAREGVAQGQIKNYTASEGAYYALGLAVPRAAWQSA
jgi:hypothetical protein